jgi:predicted RNA-binding protein with PIN domain
LKFAGFEVTCSAKFFQMIFRNFSFLFLCGLHFSTPLFSQQKETVSIVSPDFKGAFFTEVNKTEYRVIYALDMNTIQVENQRSSFVNGLYKSKVIVVTSRINEQGILYVSTDKAISKQQFTQELELIKTRSKNTPSTAVPEKY